MYVPYLTNIEAFCEPRISDPSRYTDVQEGETCKMKNVKNRKSEEINIYFKYVTALSYKLGLQLKIKNFII